MEELDSLIAYYKKNGQNPQHLILQKKMLTEGGAKKILEKKPPKEKTSIKIL